MKEWRRMENGTAKERSWGSRHVPGKPCIVPLSVEGRTPMALSCSSRLPDKLLAPIGYSKQEARRSSAIVVYKRDHGEKSDVPPVQRYQRTSQHVYLA